MRLVGTKLFFPLLMFLSLEENQHTTSYTGIIRSE